MASVCISSFLQVSALFLFLSWLPAMMNSEMKNKKIKSFLSTFLWLWCFFIAVVSLTQSQSTENYKSHDAPCILYNQQAIIGEGCFFSVIDWQLNQWHGTFMSHIHPSHIHPSGPFSDAFASESSIFLVTSISLTWVKLFLWFFLCILSGMNIHLINISPGKFIEQLVC